MPIANTPLDPVQFDFLQQNITDQSSKFGDVTDLAQSGLSFVVLLQEIPSEVDLVNPFAAHFLSVEAVNTDSTFSAVASALNTHVINRGTTPQVGDTLNTRLNRWLSDNGVLVTERYARISSGAGFIIDAGNIEP